MVSSFCPSSSGLLYSYAGLQQATRRTSYLKRLGWNNLHPTGKHRLTLSLHIGMLQLCTLQAALIFRERSSSRVSPLAHCSHSFGYAVLSWILFSLLTINTQNALISVSFQFIGFLLTYLLHTTHAARLGSRAGLGITLIQFGFALRRSDFSDSRGGTGEDIEVKSTAHEQEEYMHSLNTTYPATATESTPVTVLGSEAGAEWMAFFLMTVGWYQVSLSY
jgi:hypothetical protein